VTITLRRWRKNVEINALVERFRKRINLSLTRHAIGEKERQITRLNREWLRLRGVIEARANDPKMKDVQRALAALRAGRKSLATCNHHRAAIRGFARWAWRDGRMADDALAGVTGFNAKEERRHNRRTLGLDDLRRLIGAAHGGPAYREVTGPARALCYRLAVATGLRFAEIKSILPRSFEFSREPATVTVAAGYTKNGAPTTLPLPADLTPDLARFVATIAPTLPVFPLPDRGADMLKIDLASAGIPYRDGAGLVFDFHALRCQCATLADQTGGSPRVVQKLMRHPTLELTGRYIRPPMYDIEAATAALPSLRPTPETTEADAVAATGTDRGHINERFALPLPYTGDGSRRELPDAGERKETTSHVGGCCKPAEIAGLDTCGRELMCSVANSGGGTRTPDTRIMMQHGRDGRNQPNSHRKCPLYHA
jgi:integrase